MFKHYRSATGQTVQTSARETLLFVELGLTGMSQSGLPLKSFNKIAQNNQFKRRGRGYGYSICDENTISNCITPIDAFAVIQWQQ